MASVVSLPFNHVASLAIHGYDSVSVTEKIRKKKKNRIWIMEKAGH